MRISSTIAFLTTALFLCLPGCMFAADKKDMEYLQRDVAQLQDQVKILQSTVDKQTAAITALVQQVLDTSSRTSTSMSQLSGSVGERLNQQIQNSLKPVAGVSTDLHNVSNDTAELRSQVGELTSTMNKVLQQLNDVNNAIKVMQAPAQAPPPSNTNAAGPGLGASAPSSVPPVAAATLWTNARRDYQGGKAQLAASEFQDFLKFYPNDPMAPQAQFFIGQGHYSSGQKDLAVQDFDAVIERYPTNDITADAYFMKGRSLIDIGRKDDGVKEYKAIIAKFPQSDAAQKAAAQLRALGVTPPAASPSGAAKARAKKR